jgi:hypothetical protein
MDGCLCQIMGMDEGINDMFANFNIPNWNFKFHVHTDVSNFALGIMLGKIWITPLKNQFIMPLD